MLRIKRYHLLAFGIAFAYVGLGTLAVCSVYPADYFSGDWSTFALIVTLPISFVSLIYRFAEGQEPLYPVLIIQFVMFVVTFVTLAIEIREKQME